MRSQRYFIYRVCCCVYMSRDELRRSFLITIKNPWMENVDQWGRIYLNNRRLMKIVVL